MTTTARRARGPALRGVLGGTVAALLTLTGLAAVVPAATAAESDPGRVLVDEHFDGSSLPAGWTPYAGSWKVADGRLQSTSADSGTNRIGFGPAAPQRYRLEATVRFVSVQNASRWLNIGADYHAEVHGGAVVTLRSQTTAKNGVELSQGPAAGGAFTDSPLAAAPSDLGTGTDHDVVVDVDGTALHVTIDGDPVLSATNLVRTGGAFGFAISADSVQFDDVKVTDLTPDTDPVPPTGDPAPGTVLLDEDFSGVADGALPAGWKPTAGSWKVTGGRLQVAPGARSQIGFGPVAPANFEFQATVRFVTVSDPSRWINVGADYDAPSQVGSLYAARSQTTGASGVEHWYFAPGGAQTEIRNGPAPFDVGTGTDFTVDIQVHGGSVVYSVNGTVVLADDGVVHSGKAFAFLADGATVQFDDVRITALAPQPTPPSAPQNPRLQQDGADAAISWQAPAAAGRAPDGAPASITGYEVSIAPASAPESSLTWMPAGDAAAASYTFHDVPGEVQQVLRVRAVNDQGVAGPSASVRTPNGAATLDGLPLSLSSGPWPSGHVQGIAVDRQRGFMYYSFTDRIVKTDLVGNVIGSIVGFQQGAYYDGHLGDLDLDPETGLVYGSLEYNPERSWYLAIIDPAKITELNQSAVDSPAVRIVYLPEVTTDFDADLDGNGVSDGDDGSSPDHRFGDSGIDGVGIGPVFGTVDGPQTVTVGYGVYQNNSRTDNDNQVLLQYRLDGLAQYGRPLTGTGELPTSGPAQPDGKYFVHTGNTSFGVQNLDYDAWQQRWFLVAYTGSKPAFPNYQLFAVDAAAQPVTGEVPGNPGIQGSLLPLAADGLQDAATGIRGWNPGLGGTGFEAVGHGLYLVSASGSASGGQTASVTLDRWTGDAGKPLVPATLDYRVAPVFTSGAAAAGTQHTAYTHAFTARSYPEARFEVDGELPDGLTLDAASGVLSGTPTAAGTFAFTVVASNGTETARQDVELVLAADDTTAPTVAIAAGSDGRDGEYRAVDLSVQDDGGIERIELNGVTTALDGATRPELPELVPGVLGAALGANTLTAYDTAGNATTVAFALLPGWSPTTVYTGGERVVRQGAVWVAQWWTQGQTPGDPYGPWAEQGGLVPDAGADVRGWTASGISTGGETVAFGGHTWTAKWWTRNQQPGDPNGPWQDLGAY